jgi:pyruvate dehydrogenase E2 component (dihydrolipoamide acetyltransferase)
VELKPLSRIQKISSARLHASWVNLPHVTQHDDADITDLEAARTALERTRHRTEGVKLTPLAFIIRACIAALKEFPRFNSSLDAFRRESGVEKVLPHRLRGGYAEWPGGARDSQCRLAEPLRHRARAWRRFVREGARRQIEGRRDAGWNVHDLESGRHRRHGSFTPIINAPEVAILGVSKSSQKPVYERGAFLPRLMLPLSLSYDHRVIDGAEAARFVVHLCKMLGDVGALI